MDICQLCQQEANLCNSHILPEFIYKALYDEKHRYHVISDQEGKRYRDEQKGIREKLLCKDCELQLSKYEKYTSEMFQGRKNLQNSEVNGLIHVKGINYHNFKLFMMSILWRSGVSSLRMYQNVKLGKHEEKLRLLIASDNPGGKQDYPFMISPIVHKGERELDLIVAPSRSRVMNHKCYRFVFSGLAVAFLVSNHPIMKPFDEALLNEAGEMKMCYTKLEKLSFVMDFMNKSKNAGNI